MSGFSEDMSGKTFAQINAEPKVNPKPMVDAESLRVYLGGYVESMEARIGPMEDPAWQKYLHGVQLFNESILGWLDRNAK